MHSLLGDMGSYEERRALAAGRSSIMALASGTVALVVCAGCSSASVTDRPQTVVLDSLCSAIDDHAVAQALIGEKDALVLSVPLHVSSPDIVGCEYANPAGLSASVLDITLAPVEQSGTDRFAQLQHNQSFTQLNVNGFPIVGDIPDGITYLRFNDKNETFTLGSREVDSILTVHYKTSPVDTTPLTADSYSIVLAEHVADDINSRFVQKSPPTDPALAGKPGPMLTDDQGRPVPNPAEIVVIYDELLNGDTTGFIPAEVGITDPTEEQRWNASQMPYLEQASVRDQIALVMTVHPHCANYGCVYPGFFMTGWNSPTARADGLKLGVDPTKVPDPRAAHVVPLFASVFPRPSHVGWDGMIPPSG